MVGQLLPLLQDRRYVGETAPHLHDSLTLTPSCLKDILAVEGRRPYERSSELGIPAANCTFADIGPFEGVSLAVAESSASAAAFDRARQWLSHCLDNHPRCRDADLNEHHRTGPRRLLKLAAGGSGELQLVDFEGSTARPEYACLSYRWGDDLEGVLTTTRQNVDEHLLGICEERLPGAIVDAIRVCRELRIQYLWVDSLCILQQDDVDFAMEGSKMDVIYANSHLTIYAKHTNSCKNGFLGSQLYGQPEWQYLAPFPSVPKGLPFFIRRGDRPKTLFPLDSRGWCLQESMLPSRQLLYTGEEMVWRCNTRSFCECGHIVGDKFSDSGSDDYDDRYASHFIKAAWSIPDQRARAWGTTVEEYSRRALTDPRDKLAAISGLVRRKLHSSSTPNDRYFAGLWNEGLPNQLLWKLRDDDDRWESSAPRLQNDDAGYSQRLLNGTPTWSWASIQGSIRFGHDEPLGHIMARIDSVSCVPLHSENPLGPVKSGLLVLTAPVLPVRLVLSHPLGNFSRPRFTPVSHAHGSCPLWTCFRDLDIKQTVEDGVDYCLEKPRDALSPSDDGCTCKRRLSAKPYLACGIRLDMHMFDLPGEAKRGRMQFLLLEATPCEGTYSRVGVISGEIMHTADGEGPAGEGVGTQKLFWITTAPRGEVPGHETASEAFLKDQERFEPWPSEIELEWKQIRII